MTKRIPLEEERVAIRLPSELKFDWSNEDAIEQAMPALRNLTQIMATIVDQARERRDAETKSNAA